MGAIGSEYPVFELYVSSKSLVSGVGWQNSAPYNTQHHFASGAVGVRQRHSRLTAHKTLRGCVCVGVCAGALVSGG